MSRVHKDVTQKCAWGENVQLGQCAVGYEAKA